MYSLLHSVPPLGSIGSNRSFRLHQGAHSLPLFGIGGLRFVRSWRKVRWLLRTKVSWGRCPVCRAHRGRLQSAIQSSARPHLSAKIRNANSVDGNPREKIQHRARRSRLNWRGTYIRLVIFHVTLVVFTNCFVVIKPL